MKLTCHRAMRSSGFTLVELLVVIGIIAVLIAMLLPALNKARAASITLQCASNMRQVGQVFLLFAHDHRGRAPGGGHTGSATMAWQEILNTELFKGPYIPRFQPSANSKFFCPLVAMQSTRRSFAANRYIVDEDHAYKGLKVPAGSSELAFIAGLYEVPPKRYWFGSKLSQWKNPAQKYMVIEGERNDSFGDSNALILNDNAGYPAWTAGGGSYAFRHPKYLMNVVFIDGHVESIPYSKDAGNWRYVGAMQ